ncbi:50S ribosomal protein L34e [Candidatus Micrarchaeota archaeon CG_4_10_14_0_2_um_filter_60_11]|nr:MAG: 50S ribosomal protein L34e [Candidatus Micrarchaeota archaeon CG09_land_8_20_14_0_10_60_16]PIY91784.1 MAG: 50S ribosomal protein L34e [Candidatus Micrarchaeota archaeon CG_4_10_14_0_8_um_filter_60_7]PIZ90862.1 MAG: 50S ribosomal protein L34e [Candidatus Micrarchaeota archaeon CG_4_10_14_0_2_um_filter_60_11]
MKPSHRRMKKRYKRSLSGAVVLKFKRPKPARRVCALCGGVLHGVLRRRPSDLRKTSKSQRAPTRMFAGVLCGSCVALIVKDRARMKAGSATEKDVPLTRLKFVKQLKA